MITFIFSGLIFMVFPFLCYFIYTIYSKVTSENEIKIFFDLTLISSFYLVCRFTNLPILFLFLPLIPILLSVYKKKYVSLIILIILSSIYFSKLLSINITIFIFAYLLIYMIYKIINKSLSEIFISIEIILIICTIIFLDNKFINASNITYIILYIILSYLSFIISIKLYDYLHTMSNLYKSLEKITKEKKLYESLFKITHEIKNPLAVCKGYLDMFDVNDRKKSNRYIGIINQEIDRTLLLLNDFSNASKLNVDINIMDINMLLMDVVDESKLILKNIKFTYNISDSEICILGDYNRLKQVLLNVIKNAKESIKSNGKVKLWTDITNNSIKINIKDNGIGISSEEMKKVGMPFYTTKKNGTGLGVCFSKEIIEKHDGNINYLSKKGKGTLVTISLPIKK